MYKRQQGQSWERIQEVKRRFVETYSWCITQCLEFFSKGGRISTKSKGGSRERAAAEEDEKTSDEKERGGTKSCTGG